MFVSEPNFGIIYIKSFGKPKASKTVKLVLISY